VVFKDKESLIKHLKKEIADLEKSIDKDLKESVKIASKGKYMLTDWSIDTLGTVSDFWLYYTIDGNENQVGFAQPDREDYEALAESWGFPKEWLDDDVVADHLWTYLVYDRILTYSDANYENINDFVKFLEEKERKEILARKEKTLREEVM
jgi:hypothetical protein